MSFNLINFKKGTLQGLNTLKTNSGVEEGTFYLTIDEQKQTSRLYIGTGATTALPINSNITTVTNKTDLTDTHAAPFNDGDFAYVTNGNILAVKIGTSWRQINTPPTANDYKYLTNASYSVSTANGVATLTWTGTRSDGTDITANNLKVTGANGVTVSSSSTAGANQDDPNEYQVTVTGTSYQLSAPTVASNTATVKLQSKASASATAQDVSTLTVTGGTNVTVTSPSTGNITITSKDTKNSTLAITNGDTRTATTTTEGFTVKVTDTNGDDVAGYTNPQISVLTNQAGTTTTAVKFVNGTAALPVYTKTEVDRRISSLTGMNYAGVINESTALAQTTGHVGDTYKATEDFTISNPGTGSGTTVKTGDLLIVSASSTTVSDGNVTAGLKWDVVPSGDETDTTYTIDTSETYGFKVHEETTANDIGGLKLAQGTQMALSELTDNDNIKTVTVAHGSISTSATTGTAITQSNGQNQTFSAVTAVTTNNGHVTGVETTSITVKDTNGTLSALGSSAAVSNNVATVTTSATFTKTNGNSDTPSGSFTVGSDNLTITAGSTGQPDVKMNFVWGQF